MYNIGQQQGKLMMRRFLGKHGDPTQESSSSSITSSPTTAQPYRPSASQNAIYAASTPIGCMDRSPDGYSAVLAGSHVLKTVILDGSTIREGVDLRALITAPPAVRTGATANTPFLSSITDQFSIRDVKWGGPGGCIFTACANGKIFQYDLTRVGSGAAGGAGLEFIQIREECRQVNALDINPHRGTYLLSGSQDGRVRCFDIRAPVPSRAGLTFRTVQAFNCNADGVRHVQWSPKDGFSFACGTEQGVVVKWDIRKYSAPTLRINAHTGEKMCSAIAWHPDGDHLMSAGWDGKCHVWDVSRTADKRQKPKWTLSTPAPALALAWRPGQWSATAQARRAAQIAVAYGESNRKNPGITAVHVWDLARPTMPFKEIQRFDSSPAALLWHSQDLLWTAGGDGLFTQCDMAFAPKVIDRQAVSTMSFSSQGDVLMFLDERSPAHRPRPHALHPETLPVSSSYSSYPTGTPVLSISHSDSEDDVVGSFLGPRRRGSRKRRPSTRSSHAMSTTPPTAPGISDDLLLSLEQAIKVTGTYRPQQAMAIGHVPAAARPELYGYLTANYLETLYAGLPPTPGRPGEEQQPLVDRVAAILEHYARAAESVSLFRLAQTWRVLAYGTDLLLRRRAQYHLELRMDRLRRPSPKRDVHPFVVVPVDKLTMQMRDAPRKVPSFGSLDRSGLRSLLSEEFESTSDAATPLARPVREHGGDAQPGDGGDGGGSGNDGSGNDGGVERTDHAPRKMLTPIIEPESFTLPPAMHPQSFENRRRLDSVPLSIASQDSEVSHITQSSTEGYDFYDANAIAHAIDVPAPRRKQQAPPMMLGFVEPSSPDRRKPVVTRHDSDESFGQMFSVSEESRHMPSSLTEPPVGSMPRRAAAAAAAAGKMETLVEQEKHDRNHTDSDIGEEEYQSRIRGRQLQEEGEEEDLPAHKPAHEQQQHHLPFRQPLTRVETDMTGFTGLTGLTGSTDEQRMLTQTTTDSFESPEDRFLSQTDTDLGSFHLSQQRRRRSESAGHTGMEDDRTPHIIETDYLYWPNDPPYPFANPASSSASEKPSSRASQPRPPLPSPALQPYSLIARALAFEVKTSALNASAIILLLKPLLPDDIIDPDQAAAILRQHHSRLMGMKLFVEASLLRKLCVTGWPGSIGGGGNSNNGGDNPLASAWGENYPAVLAPAQNGVQAGLLCSSCRKPREVDRMSGSTESVWRCERCSAVMAPCAVCGHRDATALGSDYNEEYRPALLATWWFCPGCAHGGHSACLQAWHHGAGAGVDLDDNNDDDDEEADGCCPLDGCGHACLPGRWRAESAAARTEEVSRAAVREATARAAAVAAAAASAGHARAQHGHGHGHGHVHGGVSLSGSAGSTAANSFDSGSSAFAGVGAGAGAGTGVDRRSDGLLLVDSGSGGGGGNTVRYEPGDDVVESRAVETVREALASGAFGDGLGMGIRVGTGTGTATGTASPGGSSLGAGTTSGGAPTGPVSSSPGTSHHGERGGNVSEREKEGAEMVTVTGTVTGTATRERERRKSVKFVAPEEVD